MMVKLSFHYSTEAFRTSTNMIKYISNRVIELVLIVEKVIELDI